MKSPNTSMKCFSLKSNERIYILLLSTQNNIRKCHKLLNCLKLKNTIRRRTFKKHTVNKVKTPGPLHASCPVVHGVPYILMRLNALFMDESHDTWSTEKASSQGKSGFFCYLLFYLALLIFQDFSKWALMFLALDFVWISWI